MHGPSMSNPLLCNACFGQLRKYPGGAEIEISVLFADIRGSTGIAERTSAVEFRRLVQQFYLRAAKAIDQSDGIIDKFLGDGIMALFIPVMTGPMHARRAIEAGEALLRAVVDPELVARRGPGGCRRPHGSGVRGDGRLRREARFHGARRHGQRGRPARVGCRRRRAAGTATAWRAAGREGNAERRELTVKGRAEPLEVVVLGAAPRLQSLSGDPDPRLAIQS